MNNLEHKLQNRAVRKARVRAVVSGTNERPRLSVHISNRHITAQVVDDEAGKTLLAVTTANSKLATGNMTSKAEWVGSEIGKKAKTAKIKRVVFDRNGKLYHGRIKALADAARKTGLEF